MTKTEQLKWFKREAARLYGAAVSKWTIIRFWNLRNQGKTIREAVDLIYGK